MSEIRSNNYDNDENNITMPAMLKVANFQDDPRIVKCLVDSKANTFISGDREFSICLGSNSKNFDFIMKDIVIDKKTDCSHSESSVWPKIRLITGRA